MPDRHRPTDDRAAIRDLAAANQELAIRLAAAERRETDGPSSVSDSGMAPQPDLGPRVSRPRRRFARAFSWPVRRVFDPRFSGLGTQIDAKQIDLFDRLDHLRDEALAINHERALAQADLTDLVKYQDEQVALAVGLLQAQLEASAEATAILGRTLVDVRSDTQEAEVMLRSLNTILSELQTNVTKLAENDLVGAGEIEALSAAAARLLNFASSHVGFAAQRDLWINHPVTLEYVTGDVRIGSVNERIVEIPYAMRALSGIGPPAAILDVGAGESTLSLSLASLGYQVTAVDPHRYPFPHPNLEIIEAPVSAVPSEKSFDAVACVSTIEHIGIGAYGQATSSSESDLTTMEHFKRLLRPGGLLVLTVPFGASRVDELERTYDRPALDRLLDGWHVRDITIVTCGRNKAWMPEVNGDTNRDSVALATAERP